MRNKCNKFLYQIVVFQRGGKLSWCRCQWFILYLCFQMSIWLSSRRSRLCLSVVWCHQEWSGLFDEPLVQNDEHRIGYKTVVSAANQPFVVDLMQERFQLVINRRLIRNHTDNKSTSFHFPVRLLQRK